MINVGRYCNRQSVFVISVGRDGNSIYDSSVFVISVGPTLSTPLNRQYVASRRALALL